MATKKNQPPATPNEADVPEVQRGKGRKDVTGVVPGGVRVDPDLTPGHPGYEVSGGSEIIPPPNTVPNTPETPKKPAD